MAERAKIPNNKMIKELLDAAKGNTPGDISVEIKLNEEGPLPDVPGPMAFGASGPKPA